jgi:hypothetical protein
LRNYDGSLVGITGNRNRGQHVSFEHFKIKELSAETNPQMPQTW